MVVQNEVLLTQNKRLMYITKLNLMKKGLLISILLLFVGLTMQAQSVHRKWRKNQSLRA
jgi:hypothetical protein